MVRRLIAVLSFVAFAGLTSAAAQTKERLKLADYLDFEDAQDPRASPDGKQVIYTRRTIDKINDRWDNALWIVNADGTKHRFLLKGGNARWSPDGTRIAFVADGQPTGSQIHVRWMDAEGAITQITRVLEAPTDVEWSPDGKSLVFRMMVPMKEAWKVADMPAPQPGRSGPRPPTSSRSSIIAVTVRDSAISVFSKSSWSPRTAVRRGS